MPRSLTQREIDDSFAGSLNTSKSSADVQTFDIRKLDKIPKSQIQSLHLIHENFARNLASSLSAYLRSYVMLSLVSLEQISYADFLEGLSSPACLAYISLQPYDGTAVLDINTALAFRFIELLLGSKEQSMMSVQRKITDIEKKLLQTILRIVLHELHDSWKSVADINFAVQSLASEPQLLHVLAPAEAMIAIALDVRLGSTSGLINLVIPSIFIKRLRNNFEQLQKVRRTEATERDQLHVGRLLQDLKLNFEVRVPGGNVSAQTLLELNPGDVLTLEHPGSAPLIGSLNGKQKWLGNVLDVEGKLAFEIAQIIE